VVVALEVGSVFFAAISWLAGKTVYPNLLSPWLIWGLICFMGLCFLPMQDYLTQARTQNFRAQALAKAWLHRLIWYSALLLSVDWLLQSLF
ncbi:MAG: hypothetical protein AAGJ35_00215, partial [Myxococcota bacterium]